MKNLVALAVLLGAVASVATAEAAVITNTGATSGPADPAWSVMWRPIAPDGTSFGAAANAPLVTITPSPPWQPNNPPTNSWIGANSQATVDSKSDGTHRYEYAFTTGIQLLAQQHVTGAV